MINLPSQRLFKKIVGGFFVVVFVAGLFPASVFAYPDSSGYYYPVGNERNIRRSYTITPTSATVAVGSAVQFRVNRYLDGEFDKEVTLDADHIYQYEIFYTDPFYLKKGDLPGSFIGVNPGIATVVYATEYGKVSASVTVTGIPAVTSGKIQITSSKDVYDLMFPQAPDCDPQFGTHCTLGLTQHPRIPFKVDGSFNPPALMTSYMYWNSHFPNKDNNTGPRILSLEDPMNPVFYPGVSQNNILTTGVDTFGDFGSYLGIYDIAFSKDGAYQFGIDTQHKVTGWQNGAKRYAGIPSDNELTGIIDRGYKTFLITDRQTYDVSNLEDGPLPPAGLYGSGTYPTLPDGFPRMTAGKKFILSDGNYVASITNPRYFGSPTPIPTIKIYDLGKSSPVATLDISKELPYGVAGTIAAFQQKRDANTDYIVLIQPQPAVPYPNAAPSDYYRPVSVYIYKFNFLTKQLTKAVDGVKLIEGMVAGATGFNLGDQRGMIVATSLAKDYVTVNPSYPPQPTSFENRVRAYLYTDLADGKVEDVLANSPVRRNNPGFGGMSSLVVGNSTYVYVQGGYTGGIGQAVYAWKLDLKGATPPEPAGCAVSGQINPHFETGASVGSCVAVATCGTSQCTPGAGGGPADVPPPAGACGFTLTPTPQTLTVKQSDSNAIYSLKASANADPSCFITITSSVAKDLAGNTVIRPITSEASIVSPGGTTLAIFNLSTPPAGSYELNLRAYARGIPAQIIKLILNVQ